MDDCDWSWLELDTLERMRINNWKCPRSGCKDCFYYISTLDGCKLQSFDKKILMNRYSHLKKQKE
jgi:hypothetical protein